MYELSSCSIKPLIFFCTSHPTLLFMVLFFTRACTLFLSLFIWLITAPPFIYIIVRISSHAGADPWGGWWVNGKCHLKIPHPQTLPLPHLTQLVPWSNQQKWARQQKSDDTVQLHIPRENVMCLKCCWACLRLLFMKGEKVLLHREQMWKHPHAYTEEK